MCYHNGDDDDYACSKCCYELGCSDGEDGLPYNPPYKNFDQCDWYKDGWDEGRRSFDRQQELNVEDNTGDYIPETKSYVLNHLHCMLQELQNTDPDCFDFDLAFDMIESVRDSEEKNYYVIMLGKSPSYVYGPMTLEEAIVEKENRIAVHGKMGYTIIIVIEPRDLVITGDTT